MKHKRIFALALLLALLLALPALGGPGDADDPLISRSYAEGAFRSQVGAALDAAASRAVSERKAAAEAQGLTVLTLRAGETLTLRDGQQLILISGGVRLEIGSGSLTNATLGRTSTGGDARIGHRYVVWGGAAVTATAGHQGAAAAVSPRLAGTVGGTTPSDGLPFADVAESDWFYSDVAGAYRRGLVNGMDATHYAPQSSMTLAQAVKLAACMRQLYEEGAVTLANAGGGEPWYFSYARYALEHGIMDEMPAEGWDAPIDRAGFVRLFYRALPESEYTPLNSIGAGAIPDVPMSADVAREVYAFYAAGILTGYTAGNGRQAHEFGADTFISRAEVATIMNRMFDPAARVRFELG